MFKKNMDKLSEKEMYQYLNNILIKRYFKIMEYDEVMFQNISLIEKLSHLCISMYDDICNNLNEKFIREQPIVSLRNYEIIDLAREIINSIDSKYVYMFDNILQSNLLEINRDVPHLANGCSGFTYYNKEKKSRVCHPSIYLDISYSYSDVTSLVHEFFHFVQINNKVLTKNCAFLEEFLPIYSEEYSWEYLKNMGIDICRLNPNYRITSVYPMANTFLNKDVFHAKIFKIFSRCEEINEKTYRLNYKEFDDNEDYANFKKNCLNFCKYLSKGNKLSDRYTYIIATFLAFYAIKKISIEDFVKFLDIINDSKYCNSNFKDLLKIINIDIDKISLEELAKPTYEAMEQKLLFQKSKSKMLIKD